MRPVWVPHPAGSEFRDVLRERLPPHVEPTMGAVRSAPASYEVLVSGRSEEADLSVWDTEAVDACALPPDLVEALCGIRSVGVITGAGISAESGIPTYRGVGGIYEDPEEGERTVEALSGPVLRRDPDRTWRAVAALAKASVEARPNGGHRAIVRIEKAVERFVLLTQNVDGLHRSAGSENVIDIHGDVLATRCMRCDATGRLTAEAVREIDETPTCACGGNLRPDAVLFGEVLPRRKVFRMEQAFYREPPELILVVGTSALFPYIVDPVRVAARAGHLTVEVNPEATGLSRVVRFSLRGRAGDLVPRIADRLEA